MDVTARAKHMEDAAAEGNDIVQRVDTPASYTSVVDDGRAIPLGPAWRGLCGARRDPCGVIRRAVRTPRR